MVFRERTYSVLMVSASEKMSRATGELLPNSDYWPVHKAKSASQARRAMAEREYDIVIISTPLPDEFGSQLAIDASSHSSAAVLMFVKNELSYEVYEKVVEFGVTVLSVPTNVNMVSQALRTMCSMRERMRLMEQKRISVEEKIEEIRIVNHAKWLLIECLGMNEAQAQHYIEKHAQDRRVSKRSVAESIIKTYE